MKTVKLLASVFMIGTLLAPVAGFAADHDSDSSVGEFVKDSVITSKIKTKLAAEKDVSATSISVDTDRNGVVVLSGTARSQAEIDKAHSIAHSVEGVTKVKNHIKIKKDH
ncbi:MULTISPECIES: BON domain-containing protein [unclassified Nitrosospira]|uniref:BON domain-containing protein n=1 Tax=unclassified Nitrosospira TaxID=2609267 RepID=UPI000D316B64|nr:MULTISPECIES: BON domain-containing protein [unclassified Nitrosospira]PTR15264.1 hyperosmotically inducible protein [Nitrosospira sp. Nsp2]WON72765.1 BON domain-containing protein [Nitrosospira sp. Is2]